MPLSNLNIAPKLEINHSKEISNITGTVIDTIKTGRKSVTQIILNNGITPEQKITALQQENLRLLDVLTEIREKLNNIENNLNYSEYTVVTPTKEFDKDLLNNGIFFQTKNHSLDNLSRLKINTKLNQQTWYHLSKIYKVFNNDIEKFIDILKNHKLQTIEEFEFWFHPF